MLGRFPTRIIEAHFPYKTNKEKWMYTRREVFELPVDFMLVELDRGSGASISLVRARHGPCISDSPHKVPRPKLHDSFMNKGNRTASRTTPWVH
jgi:hypothetical protein